MYLVALLGAEVCDWLCTAVHLHLRSCARVDF
jgi:hypothetical protein